MTAQQRLDTPALEVHDEALPEIHELLGAEVATILDAAVGDGTVVEARPWSISYRPGRIATVVYQARVDLDEGGSWRGLMAAHAGGDFPTEASAVVSDGALRIAVWRFPDDPWITGLAKVVDPTVQAHMLAQAGIAPSNAGYHTRTYRPGRRAVLELFVPGGRVFAKVVRPGLARAIHEAHKRMEEVLPVPRSLGWTDELGVVLIEALPGITLRNALETGEPDLVEPERLIELLDALPRPESGARLTGPASRVRFQINLLDRLAPQMAASLEHIAAECARVVDPEHPVPVHGDFHSAQILVRSGKIAGMIDVDDAVLGTRADDLAMFIAGLTVVASAPSSRPTIGDYLERTRRHFEQITEPDDLRRRTAGALLGFAGGPFRIWRPDWKQRTAQLIGLAEKMIS